MLFVACTPREPPLSPADSHAIVASALTALFVNREHAGMLTIYTGPPYAALTLGDPALAGVLGLEPGHPLALAALNDRGATWPLPLQQVTRDTIEAHFARYPDGWARWYERFPGNSGIIEIAEPIRAGVDHASVLVGRSCGEHCRAAWRVFLTRRAAAGNADRWEPDSLAPLPLPRS